MGGVGSLERKKFFSYVRVLKLIKHQIGILHILLGKVPLLAVGWADLHPEKEVLAYGQMDNMIQQLRGCFTWSYKPYRMRVLPTCLSKLSKMYWRRGAYEKIRLFSYLHCEYRHPSYRGSCVAPAIRSVFIHLIPGHAVSLWAPRWV